MERTDNHLNFNRAGEVTLTPLQIANLGATIANRGYYITPHVVKSIENDAIDTLYTQKKYTKVDRIHYEEVVEGMRMAVTGGTCRMANLPDIEVCGKTGTAQNRGKDHLAFMGFAPDEQPRRLQLPSMWKTEDSELYTAYLSAGS